MNIPSRSPRCLFAISFSILVFSLSCSKDSDLLSEYAISDNKDKLFSDFVIDDVYNISTSGSITIDVLANDIIKDQSNVVITKVSNPALGIVQINEDNTITYTLGSVPPTPPITVEPEPTPETETETETGTETGTETETETEPETEPETGTETEPETGTETEPETGTETETETEPETETETEPETEIDTFNYTVEVTDEVGNTSTEEGTVTVNVEEEVIEEEECAPGQIIPEYRLDGAWSSGQNELTVAHGTEIMFSMLPNDIGLTVEFPDGSVVGDNYNLGVVTPDHNGQYLLTSSEGCTTVINLTVEEEEEPTSTAVEHLGELKAFPGAEGFGKYATGGRGGRVIEVTNLNDSGNGSLRSAIEASGARTVVFKVAGYITLDRTLNINNSDITIAGQTAPGDGITIRRRDRQMDQPALQVNTNNVVVRGIRVRAGRGMDKEHSGDTAGMTTGSNIVFDHCSFSWSTDELIAPSGATKITFQNCIFSEGLMYSSHQYTTDPNSSGYYGPHSMGMLISNGSDEITIYNSVFAHNNDRNPVISPGATINTGFELVNNVYYNWGILGSVFDSDTAIGINLINNLHIPGSNTKISRYPILINDNVTAYSRGNYSHKRTSSSAAEWDAIGDFGYAPGNMSTANQSTVPFNYPLKNEPTMNREDILNYVTDMAGAFVKDAVDIRIVQDIFNQTGSLINDPNDVGGYPNLSSGNAYTDTDKDGISDEWETANGLDANNPEDGNQDRNDDGYTNLEEFLHLLTQ